MDARSNSILFLVSAFIFIVAGVAEQGKSLATIHVMNSMPKDLGPMQIKCGSTYTNCGMNQLDEGADYQCGVRDKALYYCMAMSGRQFASWHGFQPRRDQNHTVVFWQAKKNGIFLRLDNSTWVRKSVWQNE